MVGVLWISLRGRVVYTTDGPSGALAGEGWFLHPAAPALALAAVVCAMAVWKGRRDVARAVGGAVTAAGLAFALAAWFQPGYAGSAAMALAAGVPALLAGWISRPDDAPPPAGTWLRSDAALAAVAVALALGPLASAAALPAFLAPDLGEVAAFAAPPALLALAAFAAVLLLSPWALAPAMGALAWAFTFDPPPHPGWLLCGLFALAGAAWTARASFELARAPQRRPTTPA